MSPASVCLCVLCGLPAAGKSRLVQELRGHAHGRGWRTLIVTYDELIPARDWREAEWKQQRKMLLMCLERFLHQTHTHSHQTHTHSHQTHTHSDQTHTHSHQTHTHSHQTHTHSDQTHTHSHQTHTHSHQTHTHSHQTHTHSHQTHTHSDQTHTHSHQTHTHSHQTHTHSDQTHTHSHQTHTHSHQTDADAWMRFERMLQHQIVSGTDLQPLVLLLDDNFYYQSMRLQVQQLARKYTLGFCQVFLQCPLHVCLRRNRQRSQAVPNDVLLQISERMEPPNPSRNPWEQQSLTLDGSGPIAEGDVQKLMQLLASALENPLSPVRDESQQKEADRQICASSILHRADQTCRRLVSQAVASAREQQASPEQLKALAKDLNELKSAVLQDLKKEVLRQASALPEEPVDTGQLLEEACAAFEQRTRHTVTEHTWNSTESS